VIEGVGERRFGLIGGEVLGGFCVPDCPLFELSKIDIGVDGDVDFAADGGSEDGDELVVIFDGNGIKFMIVTAGAADGEAEHGGSGSGGHVIEFIVAGAFEFLLGELGGEDASAEEPGGHHCEWVVRRDLIACELPADELVPWHIGIESLDDEVAVVEGIFAIVVLLEAVALGEARGVKPVAGPALAIVGAGEEFVDELGVGLGESGFELLGCRGKSDEGKVGAADAGVAGGGRIWGQFIFGELCEDEVVDLGLGPGAVGGGWSGIGEGFEGPELAVTLGDLHRSGLATVFYEEGLVVGGAEGDPFLKVTDESVGEFGLLGWHLGLFLVADEHEEVAFGRVVEVDGIICFAAFEEEFAGGEVEAGAGFFVAVAFEAVFDQGGADGLLEKSDAFLDACGVIGREIFGVCNEIESESSEKGDQL